ncbi:uncharacterized protein Tco025E_05245 [Trypanosoma conorhini]|uniref:PPPDE domain-containing protein n=1 Tax=Trypanosoma conorhini TaxID=83891 RepID=A0A422PEQ7_9TRYP|nr:uncharacterized protein Tco025E_05245 [Trypanosoma conorhini]RNF16205.1 hypothetical protein Tco025E_05245 [Trypanosoma conorhini]
MRLCCCQNAEDAVADKRAAIAVMEKKGLRRCTPPTTIPRQCVEVAVQINVYSLLEQNKRLKKVGMGVYHCGVVVYGIEWGYGECVESANASGMFCVYPGQAAGTLYRTVFLGVTTRSPQQVDTILHRLENEWRSGDYHILNHNCNHFAQRFCDLLSTVQKLRLPGWCNRAARVCNRVVPRKLATYLHRLVDEEPPKARLPDLSRIGEIPESVIPRGWYLHPSISQQPRYTSSCVPGRAELSPLEAGGPASYPLCLDDPSARTDVDTGSEATMATPAILNIDALRQESLGREEYSPTAAPLPLLHDKHGVLYLATGSGVCLPGHSGPPTDPTLHTSDGKQREERGNAPLAPQASQGSISQVTQIKAVEGHRVVADASPHIDDDSTQKGVVREEVQTNAEEEETKSVFYASLHAPQTEDMNEEQVLVRFGKLETLSTYSSTQELDNADAEEDGAVAKEYLKEEDRDASLAAGNCERMYSSSGPVVWRAASKEGAHFIAPSSPASSVEDNLAKTMTPAKKRGERTLTRRASYSEARFSKPMSNVARRRATVTGDSTQVASLHLEEATSLGSCVAPFAGVGRKAPAAFASPLMEAEEMNIESSGSLYSEPEGTNSDASVLPRLSQNLPSTPIAENTSSASRFEALLPLCSPPNLRRTYSYPPWGD